MPLKNSKSKAAARNSRSKAGRRDRADQQSFPDPWTLPIAHWEKIDRAHALAWLYLESLNRVYSGRPSCHPRSWPLREDQQGPGDVTIDQDDSLKSQLLQIRLHKHYWLIGCGPAPDEECGFIWIPPSGWNKENVLQLLERGKTRRVGNSFAGVVFNIYAPEKILVPAFKKAVKTLKRSVGPRAHGGGRSVSIAKLWDALRLYDYCSKSKDALSTREIGDHAKSFGLIADNLNDTRKRYNIHDINEDRGQEMKDLAYKMLSAASQGYISWRKAFPR